MPPLDDKNRIQSYQRMVDVLRCFSTAARRLTLAQIATATGLPRATVHRVLGALKEIGFIDQDARGAGYMLAIGLYELGSLSLANMDLDREAQPFRPNAPQPNRRGWPNQDKTTALPPVPSHPGRHRPPPMRQSGVQEAV
jgi:hypothetical protein